ncbi:glycosyl transferase [Treponema sp. J25]|uniref:glycosyl transferase n=1 Tax=Treponema sp. J25 TaxID=2094121 RepID=UPI001053B10C|nr:glycosyl transferase [Treponema sp. J25]TCW60528.1 glycosyl transferase [Treponema sp. J25]
MLYFCTLFDNNYLSRGLAMYESLKKHCTSFHLYILAFNDVTYSVLKDLQLEYCTIISLKDFENGELVSIKKSRSIAEYCWTCTPSLIKYCIETYNIPHCTYIDADIYFYSDPAILVEEMGENSISLSPHWYTPVYDKSSLTGIYCVQFMTFKNDSYGLNALNWWVKACNEWCYARFEDGKFGDQKYLDDWPYRFTSVHILNDRGAGVAPWNVQQYQVKKALQKGILLSCKKERKDFSVIFYHFHDVRFRKDSKIDLGSYLLPKWVKNTFYKPYIQHILKIEKKYREYGVPFHEQKEVKNIFLDNLKTSLQRIYILKHFFFFTLNFFLSKKKKKNSSQFFQNSIKKLLFNRNIYTTKYFLEE